MATTLLVKRFSVRVSEDRLFAYIRCTRRGGHPTANASEVAAVLENSKLAVTNDVTHRVHEYVEKLQQKTLTEEEFEIAAGQPAQEGTDAQFIWDSRFETTRAAPWVVPEKPDFYDVRTWVSVTTGEVIGTLIPAVKGRSGLDVFGQAILHRHDGSEIVLGEGILVDDKGRIIAQRDGRIEWCEGVLSVCERQNLDGDITGGSDKLEYWGSVNVHGTIHDRDAVHCGASLVVENAIANSSISASHDVVVGGGILGQSGRSVTASGMIAARFCENMSLRAGNGGIQVLSALSNCTTHSTGWLNVFQGAIVGGQHYAQCGIVTQEIGNEACTRTVVHVGLHPDVICYMAEQELEVAKKRASIERVRQMVRPLMAQIKRLNSEQREKATDLLYQADEMENAVRKILGERHRLMRNNGPEERVEISVEGKVYDGVILYIDDYRIGLNSELRGPLKLYLMETAVGIEAVVHNTFTNTRRCLTARKLTPEELRKIKSLK